MKIITVTLHPAIDKVIETKRIIPNESCRARIKMIYGGGKGNNVARALTRLNIAVIATGFQGGYTGEYITTALKNEGIHTEFVFCQAPTRTSTIILEEDTGDSYAVYEPGQNIQIDEASQLLSKVIDLSLDASLILLCGSGQYPALEYIYYDIILMAKERNIRCLLDSSGLALKNGISAKPYMVKVNQHELSDYFQRPLVHLNDQLNALNELHQSGISVVAMSRGADGLIVTDGKEFYEAKLSMTKTIFTVGAGDSLLAGFAKALVEGCQIDELARLGVACGTANTQVAGAGFITSELVNQLLPKVKIRKIYFY